MSSIDDLRPLLAEIGWHWLTADPMIPDMSKDHFVKVERILEKHWKPDGGEPVRILEVGAYAHTTGYMFENRLAAEVTLFDISAKALKLGRRMAGHLPSSGNPILIAGDFLDLPFEDECFDLVYVCSSVHHTQKWRTVIDEMLRVLNAEGLLFVENEPCHRLCCLYKFRTNRREDFTPFEKKLEELGTLRTFAEPYPGSRPESLFGMVENQNIPLGALLAKVEKKTETLDTVLNTAMCMGDLERSWLGRADLGPETLKSVIYQDLVSSSESAASLLGPVEIGCDFMLPEENELRKLASEVALAICELPPSTLGTPYSRGLAEIFGAGVQLLARKRGSRVHPSSGRTNRHCPREDGIFYSFKEQTSHILMECNSQLPDIQTAKAKELAPFFPEVHWLRTVSQGFVSLALYCQPGAIRIPKCRDERLLIIRYQCLPPAGRRAVITLRLCGREVYSREVWRRDAYLCVVNIPGMSVKGSSDLSLLCEVDDGGGPRSRLENAVAIFVAGLYAPEKG